MTRYDQIKAMLAFMKDEYGLAVSMRGGSLDMLYEGPRCGNWRGNSRVTVMCNQAAIAAYLSGDPSLNDLPAEKVITPEHRIRNGCAERCPMLGKCICEGGCFPTMANKCPFCDVNELERQCMITDPGKPSCARSCGTKPRDWEAWYSAHMPALLPLYRQYARIPEPDPAPRSEYTFRQGAFDCLMPGAGKRRRRGSASS